MQRTIRDFPLAESPWPRVEAWVRGQLLARLMSLLILPAEMGIESGGFRGVVPRKIARTGVNPLLVSLGQPPIQ